MQPQVLSGQRTILKINNEIVGAGFVLDYSIETQDTVIQGIDNVLADEIAPNSINVSMSIRVYRTPDNDPVATLIAPLGDSANVQDAFPKSPYITIEVRDKTTDKTILFLPKAFVTRRSGSVEAEGLLTETWSIKSIGFQGPGAQDSGIGGAIKGIFGTNPFA
jgi:hypothetical protein